MQAEHITEDNMIWSQTGFQPLNIIKAVCLKIKR